MMDGDDIGGGGYIEEDEPAQGYGPGKVEERRVNVTTGQLGATRTIVLHVPKDIKQNKGTKTKNDEAQDGSMDWKKVCTSGLAGICSPVRQQGFSSEELIHNCAVNQLF